MAGRGRRIFNDTVSDLARVPFTTCTESCEQKQKGRERDDVLMLKKGRGPTVVSGPHEGRRITGHICLARERCEGTSGREKLRGCSGIVPSHLQQRGLGPFLSS